MGKFAQSIADRAFRRPRGMLGRLGGFVMVRTHRSMYDMAVGALAPQPGERILEVGCGPGAGLQALLAAGAIPVGVDPSPLMLALARERAEAQDTELFCAPAEHLPFIDAAFDAVLAVDCLHICAAPLRALDEIRRVLRPGGRLVLAGTRCEGCNPAGMIVALQMARFCSVRSVEKSRHFMIVAHQPESSGPQGVAAALRS